MEKPDYNKIYLDLLERKFPDKLKIYESLLIKNPTLSVLDVIRLNESIFTDEYKKDQNKNQKYKSYDKAAIIKILTYQKKNCLNNLQLSNHFKLSRNTVTKWKKKFIV